MRRRLAILVFGALLAASAPAWADTGEAMKAFAEGQKLRDQRDFDKAATAFERSVAAEPSVGAYYNLGFSYEQLGRTRDGLDAYRQAALIAKDKRDPRADEANDAIAKLLDTHNYVTLQLADDIAATTGLRVVVDGEVVPAKQHKGEVFRSASQHQIVISAPGRKDVRLQARNKQSVSVVLGEPYGQTATPPTPPTPPPADTGGGWGWQKWAGVGVGAAGLVTVAVGVVLNLKHNGNVNDLDAQQPIACRNDTKCGGEASLVQSAEALNRRIDDENSSAKTTLPIVYSLGTALFVGGLVLFFTAPSDASATTARVRMVPQVGMRDTGLAVVGTF